MKLFIFLCAIGLTYANICTDDTGYWMMSIAEGVRDFYYGGSLLNTKYYCFEGCLNTGTALQNYKVQLAGTNATAIERKRTVKQIKQQVAARPDDPNADFCVDPVLRTDIANALDKNTQPNCKGIINTLVLNLNRQGWAMTCMAFDGFALDGVVSDKNFCSYDAFLEDEIYTIRLAKLDMS